MSEPIISVSGLRGIVGDSLTPDIAARYARAFAAELGEGPILITRDGRSSGPMLAAVLRDALTAIGRDVIDAQVAATPTTGVLVRHLQAAGGIQISASHNPSEYNGLKLFASEGRVIPEIAGNRVIERYRRARISRRLPAPAEAANASIRRPPTGSWSPKRSTSSAFARHISKYCSTQTMAPAPC